MNEHGERLVTDPPWTVDEVRARIDEHGACYLCEEQGWLVAFDGEGDPIVETCACLSGADIYDSDVRQLPEALRALRAARARMERAEGPEWERDDR